MPELYLIGFDAFELRTQGGVITNEEISGGNLVGWNTDAPDGTTQDGGTAAQEWVDNNYNITFTSFGQFYDITDPNGDVEFHDDDADQTLTNDITFGTETYPAGAQIEAEFHIIVEDPVTGQQWTLAGVNFGGSGGSNFHNIEAIAVVDNGTNGLPPLGQPLNIIQSIDLAPGQAAGDTLDYGEYAPCFAEGAMIRTPGGLVAVQDLRVGDIVETLDSGPRALNWVGSRSVYGRGPMAPIMIPKGAFGASADLSVSPQHRILISTPRSELMVGEREALVKARDLVGRSGVRRAPVETVTYFHLLFDRHEIVFANGVASESFQPGVRSMSTFDQSVRAEILNLFPELGNPGGAAFRSSRYTLKRWEVRAMGNAL